MIEIIPNWHPMLVHVTVGMLTCSVLFYIGSYFAHNNFRLHRQWVHVANWSLWAGCFFALLTIMTGWHAYNTVTHDAVSHAAMTLHRNWALPTASFFIILGIISIRVVRRNRQPSVGFISAIFFAFMLLVYTGWLGAEGVYRYGLGVMALPNTTEQSHHSHDVEQHQEHDHSSHSH